MKLSKMAKLEVMAREFQEKLRRHSKHFGVHVSRRGSILVSYENPFPLNMIRGSGYIVANHTGKEWHVWGEEYYNLFVEVFGDPVVLMSFEKEVI